MRPAAPFFVALLCAVLLAPLAAAAQPAATEESRAAARSLGEEIGIAGQVRDVLAQIRADLVTRTMHESGKWADEATPIVDEVLMPGFTARADELAAVLLEPWASEFTPRELRLLHSFFASPLGHHYLRQQASLARKSADGWQAWSQRVFRETVDQHMAELRARGVRF